MSKKLAKQPSLKVSQYKKIILIFFFKNILKKRQDNDKEVEASINSKESVQFNIATESESDFSKSSSKGKWQIGGRTVQALFNKKDKADKAAAGLPDGPPEVKRIFSFPLNGDAEADDIRNVYTDFR